MGLKKIALLGLLSLSAGFAAAQSRMESVAPEVPKSVTFAGTTISTDRADVYERLDRELLSMSYGHTNTFLTIKRANRYMAAIVRILKQQGVPGDFVYLAAIESHFDNTAVSSAKAVGMWQFMPSTAKEYGLEVNDYVDERLDFEKATVAACKYFKSAYSKYGSWIAAAAAYNAGMNRITQSFADQKVDDVFDLYLNRETSRYIFRLFAMKLVLENPRKYGYSLKASQLYQPYDCETVSVSEPVGSWVDWAKSKGMTYAALKELNPWIRKDSLPNKSWKTYKVKVMKQGGMLRSGQTMQTYNENWIR